MKLTKPKAKALMKAINHAIDYEEGWLDACGRCTWMARDIRRAKRCIVRWRVLREELAAFVRRR